MLDATQVLQQAISIPSVSGQEAPVAQYLVSQMATYCDQAFIDDSGSAVGQWGWGPLKVYFLGHIDTVPGEIPVRIEDGKLYGRGSVDAKGRFLYGSGGWLEAATKPKRKDDLNANRRN